MTWPTGAATCASAAARYPMSIMRDKHEQTVVMSLPAAPNSSRLEGEDWDSLGTEMQAVREEMEKLRPELERSQQELVAKLHQRKRTGRDAPRYREVDEVAAERYRENAEADPEGGPVAAGHGEDRVRSKSQDVDEKQRDVQATRHAEKQQMRREVEESMKTWTPQLQRQMEQLRQQIWTSRDSTFRKCWKVSTNSTSSRPLSCSVVPGTETSLCAFFAWLSDVVDVSLLRLSVVGPSPRKPRSSSSTIP